jgi:chromosome segregation ATPase
MKTAASTNAKHSTLALCLALQSKTMANPSPIDQLSDRLERLLVRYEELMRTNTLLSTQVQALTQERDSLKSRLSAARARVDALLARLPETNKTDTPQGSL